MRYDTALRRLTKRANDFLGMTFNQYVVQFTYLNGERLVLNDNTSMQKAFAVWVAHNNHEAVLVDYHQRKIDHNPYDHL